jgi:4'-phosphopantetheinyl transferase
MVHEFESSKFSSSDLWPLSSPRLRATQLAVDEIHIWRVDLPRMVNQLDALVPTLTEAEKSRAGQFYFENDQRSYLLQRGLLRQILAGYLGIRPQEVAFQYSSGGQPRLVDTTPKFSLAHSGDLMLIAITHDTQIGIDVEMERILSDTDMTRIVCRRFSPEERHEYFALPAGDHMRAFYCGWTRKEAFLKAIGQGLAFGLDQVTVTLDPNQPAQLLALHGRSLPASRWSLYPLAPRPGYIGALAASGTGHRVVCWQLDSSAAARASTDD